MLLEVREHACLRNEKYKALITWMANKKIRVKDFLEGLLVLKQAKGPYKASKKGKLAMN